MLRKEKEDEVVDQWRHRGDITREAFVDFFLNDESYTGEDAILLLDADQLHPPDMLEKLRAHDLDMVCAHCYRRNTHPIQSLCYEIGDGTFPFLPYPPKKIPRSGLHEIAVTGFGCVLIKKKVLQAVKDTLPKGANPIAIGPMPEIVSDHGNWGPDFRFFIRARKLGYKLWLDANIESLHSTNFWLGHKSADYMTDYMDWATAAQDILKIRLEMYGVELEAFKQRKRLLEVRLEGFRQKALEASRNKDNAGTDEEKQKAVQEHANFSIAVYEMEGRIKEMNAWIEWSEKYPNITRPDQLPTTENTEKMRTVKDVIPDIEEAKKERAKAYKATALEFIDMLPDVENEPE